MATVIELDHPGCLRVALSESVVTLTFDAPPTHALSHAVVEHLGRVFGAIERAEVGAVVLAGGDEWFSSGASREVIEDLVRERRDAGEILLPRLLLECPVPVIAAMAGSAIGGGFALGIAADLVMIARESRYSLNFLELGFTPGMGTTRLLEHVLSTAIAHELLYSGEARRGRDFDGRSGINAILPRAEVLPRALDLAARIAGKPRAALVSLKRALSLARRQAFEAARTQEAQMHALSFSRPGAAQRILESLAET